MSTIRRLTALTIVAAAFAAEPVSAQGPATLKALGAYRLTMPTLRKVIAAGKAAERGPDADAIKQATGQSAMSIEHVMGVFDRYPSARNAVAASGLSSREFATAYLAFYYTTRYLADDQMRRALGQTPPGPPAHVNPANVELVRNNQEEIARLTQGN
jgi:ABC-type Fe3+ transport system substrate-binding protein